MLRVDSLEAGYGDVCSLSGASLEVGEGEIVALLGANGAGKTSLLRTVSGLLEARAGSVELRGRAIEAVPAPRRVDLGIGHVPEGRQIFGPLTVRENLEVGAVMRARRAGKGEIQDSYDLVYELFPVLRDRSGQLGGTLSGGEQQMLAIARALMAGPSFLMLDEPSLGLAPMVVESIFEALRSLNRGGLTILLVEQNAEAALEVAHRGYVLELGTVVHEGTAADLAGDESVRSIYFGSRQAPAR